MANRIRRGVGGLWVSVPLLLLALGPPAAAARKPITGKLSKPGYTVLALAKNGKANLVHPKGLSFRLRPPAEVVTLHLRAHDGTYGGPIVVARKKHGKRAILGLRAGAKLGEVEVRAGKGYANVMRKPPERFVDATRRARARKGGPIGAGNFGHVLSRHTRGGAPGDLDLDGIPNPLDVDDDGDLVLDNLDISSVGGGARAAQTQGGCGFYCPLVSSGLSPSRFEDTRNVNAGSTLGQINEILKGNGVLRFSPISDTAELDCGGEEVLPDGWDGGRPYCTRGGTGTTFGTGSFLPFPGPKFGDFDLDGDGFGTFQQPSFLAPHADTTEIKTGDPLTMWDDSTGTKVSTALNFVFVTTPALVSYSDTAGNCAKVSGTPGSCTTEFSYPVPPGDPGTMVNGFPLSAPAGDDVVLTLTFWRPQRQPLANDPPGAQWMDIGHLKYAVGGCSQGTLFTTDDNLKPPVLPILGAGSLEDQKDDELSSPGNTLTYTLKLSQCLAEQGSSSSFDEPGEELNLNFSAVSGATDSAQQSIWFKRQ